jgi:hypothetical protein
MRRSIRLTILIASLASMIASWPSGVQAQVDPVFDRHADLRVLVTPKDAGVYVDDYYMGIVDDFNGLFQRLPLRPGEHEVVVYLEGYRTVHRHLTLAPGATYKLHWNMDKLPAGERSEAPGVAPPPVPPAAHGAAAPAPLPPLAGAPLPGTVPSPRPVAAQGAAPVAARGATLPPAPAGIETFGAVSIRVQPAGAEVAIDGQPWGIASDHSALLVQIAEGRHHVEIQKNSYKAYSADVEVRRGETVPLNVNLAPDKSE